MTRSPSTSADPSPLCAALSGPQGSAPTLCSACENIAKESNLVWKRVGGQCVGDYRQPVKWQLRDKYSVDMMAARATEMQRLTGALRYLHATLPHLPEDMKANVERFLSSPNNPVSQRRGYAPALALVAGSTLFYDYQNTEMPAR
jgi:hypothetical protein